MTEEEKKAIKQKKHPGCVTQVHNLATFMKKRKEEILRNKEQSTEQSTVQSTVQSNDIFGFFTYNKKAGQVIHEQPIKPKRRQML